MTTAKCRTIIASVFFIFILSSLATYCIGDRIFCNEATSRVDQSSQYNKCPLTIGAFAELLCRCNFVNPDGFSQYSRWLEWMRQNGKDPKYILGEESSACFVTEKTLSPDAAFAVQGLNRTREYVECALYITNVTEKTDYYCTWKPNGSRCNVSIVHQYTNVSTIRASVTTVSYTTTATNEAPLYKSTVPAESKPKGNGDGKALTIEEIIAIVVGVIAIGLLILIGIILVKYKDDIVACCRGASPKSPGGSNRQIDRDVQRNAQNNNSCGSGSDRHTLRDNIDNITNDTGISIPQSNESNTSDRKYSLFSRKPKTDDDVDARKSLLANCKTSSPDLLHKTDLPPESQPGPSTIQIKNCDVKFLISSSDNPINTQLLMQSMLAGPQKKRRSKYLSNDEQQVGNNESQTGKKQLRQTAPANTKKLYNKNKNNRNNSNPVLVQEKSSTRYGKDADDKIKAKLNPIDSSLACADEDSDECPSSVNEGGNDTEIDIHNSDDVSFMNNPIEQGSGLHQSDAPKTAERNEECKSNISSEKPTPKHSNPLVVVAMPTVESA